MAGAGSRFSNAGYILPKPLIDVRGKPMIEHAVKSIGLNNCEYIYLVQDEHYYKYNLEKVLNKITPDCKIIKVNGLTDGAARTCLLAKNLINNSKPLIILNSDSKIEYDSDKFLHIINKESADSAILTFYSDHPKWSYVVEKNGNVINVVEKEVVSNKATAGIYYFKTGSMFVNAAETMISKNLRVNNEFYVAPCINQIIENNGKVISFDVNRFISLGTPEDLLEYLDQ